MASILNVKTIVLALRKTFNIKTTLEQTLLPYEVKTKNIEVSSTCKVSQNADDLILYAQRLGFTLSLLDFLPYNRWACVVRNKIKVLWKGQPAEHSGITLQGYWKDDVFYPDIEDPDIIVSIKPTKCIHNTHITLQSTKYKVLYNMIDDIPSLKLGETRFQCMGVICVYEVCINEKGIYINRTSPISVPLEDNTKAAYTLTIQYKKKVLLSIEAHCSPIIIV